MKREVLNPFEENAIQVLTKNDESLGYIPRYYCSAFIRLMNEGREIRCHIASVDMRKNCNECIAIVAEF